MASQFFYRLWVTAQGTICLQTHALTDVNPVLWPCMVHGWVTLPMVGDMSCVFLWYLEKQNLTSGKTNSDIWKNKIWYLGKQNLISGKSNSEFSFKAVANYINVGMILYKIWYLEKQNLISGKTKSDIWENKIWYLEKQNLISGKTKSEIWKNKVWYLGGQNLISGETICTPDLETEYYILFYICKRTILIFPLRHLIIK